MSFFNLFKTSFIDDIKFWHSACIDCLDLTLEHVIISKQDYWNLCNATNESKNICLKENSKEALDRMKKLHENLKTKFIEMARGKQ